MKNGRADTQPGIPDTHDIRVARSRLRRILLWGAAVLFGLLILGSLAYFSAPLILAGEPQSRALIEQLPDGSVEPSASGS